MKDTKRTYMVKRELNITSYNISWESMEGINLKNKKYSSSGKDIKTKKDQARLKKTVHKNLKDYLVYRSNSDFILIQEAHNFRNVVNTSPTLTNRYKMIYHKSGLDKMCLLYNKKYTPMKKYIRKKEFHIGRPYLIVPFKEKICMINVHLPHTKHLENKMMKNAKKNMTLKQCMGFIEKDLTILHKQIPQFDKYTIIIGGDFNTELPASWNLGIGLGMGMGMGMGKRKLYRYKSPKPTCCYLNDDKISFQWYLDQFYCSKRKTARDKCQIDFPRRPLSDHLPIHLTMVL